MKDYCKNKAKCRRSLLLEHFEESGEFVAEGNTPPPPPKSFQHHTFRKLSPRTLFLTIRSIHSAPPMARHLFVE